MGDGVPLCPARQGVFLCLLLGRWLVFNAPPADGAQTRVLRSASQTRLGTFSSMTVARDGGLWLAGARGLAKGPAPLRNLKPETDWQGYVPPDPLQGL